MVCIRDGTASPECPDRSSILVRPAIDDAIGRLVVPSFRVVVAHPPQPLLDVVPVGVDVLLDYAQENRALRLLLRLRQGGEVVAEGLGHPHRHGGVAGAAARPVTVPVELERHGLKRRCSEDKASRTEPYPCADLHICNGRRRKDDEGGRPGHRPCRPRYMLQLCPQASDRQALSAEISWSETCQPIDICAHGRPRKNLRSLLASAPTVVGSEWPGSRTVSSGKERILPMLRMRSPRFPPG